MKLNTRDLAPNPFRDIKNYPFDKEKIENLKNSISETGFWDNILARKPEYANYYEIAYGHHRLEALRQLFPDGLDVEIPVKELDDSTMLRIMANENMEMWSLSPRVVDETVRVTQSYLDEHPDEVRTKDEQLTRSRDRAHGHNLTFYRSDKEAFQIAEFLGKGWSEERVYNSLKRLQLIEEKIIDKRAVHSFKSTEAADNFTKVVQDHGLTKTQQRKVASEINASSKNVGKSIIDATARSIKYPVAQKPKKSKKKLPTDFDQSMADLASDIRAVNKSLDNLYSVLNEHGQIVVDKIVALNLTTSMKSLYYKVEKILKESHQID